jgi:poly(A) polymerase
MNFLNKLFKQSRNFNYINLAFQKLSTETEAKRIFKAISDYSENSEIRYVGGCVRKIINNEIVDDIDLAVNLNTKEVSEILKKNQIKFYETGIEHGTITALINENKFEITSLRKDVVTDGRHAKIEFSQDWYEDASRRDFSINAIYADIDGNLYDPFNGKKNIENGTVQFIGEEEKRIKEDYLRVIRYVRFFLNYSKKNHNPNVLRIIKKNLDGIFKISSERLLDEFKKLSKSNGFIKLNQDKFCLEIINLIFPQFKNINILKNIKKNNTNNLDFIILLSALIIDSSDNTEYFLFKFNLSKKDQKRILFLKEFFIQPINKKTFTKENLWKILYYKEKQHLIDLLNYQILRSKKNEKKLSELIIFFKNKITPKLPIKANYLMSEFNIPEGKELGLKLKKIEEKWLNNNFKISDIEIRKLILN